MERSCWRQDGSWDLYRSHIYVVYAVIRTSYIGGGIYSSTHNSCGYQKILYWAWNGKPASETKKYLRLYSTLHHFYICNVDTVHKKIKTKEKKKKNLKKKKIIRARKKPSVVCYFSICTNCYEYTRCTVQICNSANVPTVDTLYDFIV